MPLYSYRCRRCGTTEDIPRRVYERDEPVVCRACKRELGGNASSVSLMERVATSASFEIKGFNAKNGYSK